ncbi:hypothetical protein WJX75_009179 [Coccomyxa subellipsoidea]|uniref:Nuclease associated modular domain-containing protein n=1 Tax=Coccomyxa subellipsoidea TaxID=248742 RepID=A0ABR2Z041_9CHLO
MHLQLVLSRVWAYPRGPFLVSRKVHRPLLPKVLACQVQQRASTLGPPESNFKEVAVDQEEKYGKTRDIKKKTRQFSDEHKAKLSAAARGRQFSDEHKAKLSAAWAKRGNFSKETREKMRLAKLGKQHSIISRSKMSRSQSGRKLSEETKLRMSRSHKLRWERRKQQLASQQPQQNHQAPREVKRKVSNGALQARWEDEQLSREAAVFELVTLRREVGHLVAELSERGELPETAEEVGLHPNVHRKLWRYVWLLDQVRSAPLM